MPHPLVIATITLARHEEESRQLLQALAVLTDQGLPVVAADGGSIEPFIQALHQFPHLSLHRYQPGSGPRLLTQVKTALQAAAELNPDYVLYTEPDKQWFFEHRLQQFVAGALAKAPVGVALAARDATSFLTYPPFQRYTEQVTAQLSEELLEQPGDILYGPLLLQPALVPYVTGLTEDIGWGWRPFVMVVAHRLGLPVTPITLDLPCPPTQRDEDDKRARLYRLEQLAQNARGLVLGAKWNLS